MVPVWMLLSFASGGPIDLLAPLGTEQWERVEQLTFAFNTERDGVPKSRRLWTWRPAEGTVTRTIGDESVSFRFGQPTNEQERKADAQFVNDSFWLMPHLHARWGGSDLTVLDGGTTTGPLGVGTTRLVTLRYAADSGGYSPGDAYDLFLDANGRMVAWHFREGGQAEPSLTTTFEGWRQVGPLWMATERRDAAALEPGPPEGFRVFFTDLAVEIRPDPTPSPASE
jgi:hypothetical protein